MARNSGCPVWVGKDRAATARALLAANPDCNVIVSDDGLQHYRLTRDVEIAVVDGARGHGNGFMLPAGPLREPVSRLETVNAVVLRGATTAAQNTTPPRFTMTLAATALRNLRSHRMLPLTQWRAVRVHAIAGIGNPQQFFDALTAHGIAHTPHAFADHHAYSARDLTFNDCDAVVMTEKDAVKCERFASEKHWALQAEAHVDDTLAQWVIDRIKRKH